MSKEKNTKTKHTSTKIDAPKKPNRFLALLRTEQTRFIIGFLLILVGALLALAFTSFLVNAGKADADVLAHGTAIAEGVKNWTGALGATAASWFINEWIGVSAFLYVAFIIRLGYRLIMHNKPLAPMFSQFVHTCIWSLWLSLFFGFVFIDGYEDSFLYLGGHHGYDLEQLLERCVGYPGLLLCLFVSLIIMLTFIHVGTINQTRSAFGLYGRWLAARRARAAAQEPVITLTNEEAPEYVASRADVVDQKNPESEEIEDPLVTSSFEPAPEEQVETVSEEEVVEVVGTFSEEEVIEPVETISEEEVVEPVETISEDVDPDFQVTSNVTEVVEEEMQLPLEDYDPTKDLEFYQFP
ncbi:MAG: DNA translocase FtsK 4TM domain-containing protein, partial [Bacteroidales bacterium]|nr:DNA translocase FtsK 4TM domain-containing protein [Bacteroidales bacterium]